MLIKDIKSIKLLITGLNGNICEECAAQAYQIVQESGQYSKKNEGTRKTKSTKRIPKPKEIKEFLDLYVIGHDEVKKVLAVAVHNHYRRLEAAENVKKDDVKQALMAYLDYRVLRNK